jgi:hypothetical protein
MITDFNEIKDEKDRELYVEFRNILDNFFMTRVEEHKDKDHRFNECESLEFIDDLIKIFPERLAEECKETESTERENIEWWINQNEGQWLMYMANLVILRKELNKRLS